MPRGSDTLPTLGWPGQRSLCDRTIILPAPCARDKACREGCSGRFGRLVHLYRLSSPKPFQEPLRLVCHPHSRKPFLSAVRRTLSGVSCRRRLPFRVGERVFGEAKKGRWFLSVRFLTKVLSMIRESSATELLRTQALSYPLAQRFR